MSKYVYEFGQRFDARVPRRDIAWLVGRYNVAKPESEIEAWIRDRAKDFPETLIRHCVRYAIACHRKNFQTYCWVMGSH